MKKSECVWSFTKLLCEVVTDCGIYLDKVLNYDGEIYGLKEEGGHVFYYDDYLCNIKFPRYCPYCNKKIRI